MSTTCSLLRVAALAIAVVVFAAGCSSAGEEASSTTVEPAASSSSSSTTSASTTTTLPEITDPFVEVNGARLVYRCSETGDVPVLVDHGLFIGSFTQPPGTETYMGWGAIADLLPPEFKFCVYNRRGLGQSDKVQADEERTSQDQVDDLIAVIEALDLGPVILVGHSMAGFSMRLIAEQRPDLMAGQVYVEASHPDQLELFPADDPPSPQPPEWLDIEASADLVPGIGENDGILGDRPIVVLTGLKGVLDADQAIWLELHADHAAQSETSSHDVLEDAGHFLFLSNPEDVANAIEWVATNAAN